LKSGDIGPIAVEIFKFVKENAYCGRKMYGYVELDNIITGCRHNEPGDFFSLDLFVCGLHFK
jgi:hypothetical protein